MWLEVVLFLWISAIVLSVISFIRVKGQTEILLLPFLAGLMFIAAGISSFSIEKSYCQSNVDKYINSTYIQGFEMKWTCHENITSQKGLAWFGFGLGAIMIVYGILSIVYAEVKEIDSIVK